MHHRLRRASSLILIFSLLLAGTVGCSKAPEENTPKPFQLLVMAPHVSQDLVTAFGDTLTAQAEELQTVVPAPLFTAHSMGSEEISDPSLLIGANMKVVGMAADRALHIIICDEHTAMQFSANGLFSDPTSLFTEAELAPFADRILALDIPDMEGQPSGETTGPIGIDMSHCEALRALTGEDTAGLYIVDAGNNLELSKKIFLRIAAME